MTKRVVLGVFAAAVLILMLGHLRYYFRGNVFLYDFKAFYCGGQVVLHGADVYRLEPLLSCERTLGGLPSYGAPVPLPPYDLGPLALIALFPFSIAKALLGVLELAAVLGIAYAMKRLSVLPYAVALGVAFFGVGYEAEKYGQITPFAIAFIALAAVWIREKRYLPAAIAVCASLIQPQFGAPAVIGAFLLLPAVRVPIVAFIAGLFAIGLPFGGIGGAVEYARLLPLHALAEDVFAPQYSATFVAHQLGASDATALALGSACYAVMLAFGLALVCVARKATLETGAAVLLPAAFSVLGGSFIHAHQIAVAVPAATTPKQHRATSALTSLGLAWLICPWMVLANVPLSKSVMLTAIFALITVALATYFLNRAAFGSRGAVGIAAACALVALVTFGALHATRPPGDVHLAPVTVPAADLTPDTLGPTAWGAGIRQLNAESAAPGTRAYDWDNWYIKIPTWLGLVLILGSATCDLIALKRVPESYPSPSRGEPGAAAAAAANV